MAEELAQHGILIAPMRFDMVERLEEHANGSAGRVINGFTGFGCKYAYHQCDDRARGIELNGLLVGQVRLAGPVSRIEGAVVLRETGKFDVCQ